MPGLSCQKKCLTQCILLLAHWGLKCTYFSDGLHKLTIGLGFIYINGATIDKNDISIRPVSQDRDNSQHLRRDEDEE